MTVFRLIIDCQYGSTGKGLFAGYLSAQTNPEVLVMAPSPNAGHTLVMEDGTTVVHKMLPLGILSNRLRCILLGPGSMIDPDRLLEEVLQLHKLGVNAFICVAHNAGIVLAVHREAEAQGGTAPGSTRSGAGAALIDKVRRSPCSQVFGNLDHPVRDHVLTVNTNSSQRILADANAVQVEGCQGYGLSIHHGHYPHVTSRDVTTAQLIADCGIPYVRNQLSVYGTFRTYPIRVANRPGEWSGPTYPDSRETTFEAIGQPQEYTTVTKLPRRIFTWSEQLAREATRQNRVDIAFLNFAQYPQTFDELRTIRDSLEQSTPIRYFGFGPRTSDVYRISAPAIGGDIRLRQLWDQYRDTAARDSELDRHSAPEPDAVINHCKING